MANVAKIVRQQSYIPTEQKLEHLDFLGMSVPVEVTKMVQLLDADQVKQVHFRSTVQFVINFLKGSKQRRDAATKASSSSSIDIADIEMDEEDAESEGFRSLFAALRADGSKLSAAGLQTTFAGLYVLLRAAYRTRLPLATFRGALGELQMQKQFAADLSRSYELTQAPMEDALVDARLMLPQIEETKWRVDVTLSTSSLSRLAEPSIFFELRLSDGSVHQFDCTVVKFHELRYNVARVLKDMSDIEKAPILRLE
jgi:COMM domain